MPISPFSMFALLLTLNSNLVAQSWTSNSFKESFDYEKEVIHDTPKEFDSYDSRKEQKLGRLGMIQEAFEESLTDLTYCYPGVKFSQIMELNSEVRNNPNTTTNGEITGTFYRIRGNYPDLSSHAGFQSLTLNGIEHNMYKSIVRGNNYSSGVEIRIKWEYLDVQRYAGVYAKTELEYKSRKYNFSGCHCTGLVPLSMCEGWECSEEECEKATSGNLAGPQWQYFPKDYNFEFIDATIYISPLIFESSSFYFGCEKKEPWIKNMQRSLLYIFLHEFGHIEEFTAKKLNYGDKISFGDKEEDADCFAVSVLRCVE